MPRQLTLELPARTSLGRGEFFVSEANALAVARLDDPESWPSGKLVLIGPEGAGKTHLAHVWADNVRAGVIAAADLPALDVSGIDGPVAVDAADRADPAGEAQLFHLHNRLADAGYPLLLTARDAPARWNTALPDLRSRMEASDIVRINAPDDALLAAVLVKLFADRQLHVTPAVIAWLTRRMDRSFAEAQRLVRALDQAALAESRAITQPLARAILDKR